MTPRERAARARFKIAFKEDRSFLVRKFNDDVAFPGAVARGVWTAAGVVVFQSLLHVGGQTDIKPRTKIRVPQDINEALLSGHAANREQTKCLRKARMNAPNWFRAAGRGGSS